MEQIAGQKTRTWQSHRAASEQTANNFRQRIAEAARQAGNPARSRKGGAPMGGPARRASSSRSTTKEAPDKEEPAHVAIEDCPTETPHFAEPMKARLVESLPPGENRLLELKHDGYRALAVKNGNSVELFSRNRKLMNGAFPSIAEAVRRLPKKAFVIDGEIVALNDQGYGSFQLLQNRETIRDAGTLVFYVFDVLNLDGRNVRDLPLAQRRGLVQQLLAGAGDPIRFSAAVKGAPADVLAEVKRLGLEGLIAKKPQSRYEAGQRSGAWVKLKCVSEQEFVIGGYTPPKGSRDHFGALLVGYFEGGKLMFASKVGSGYTQATLRDLFKKFQPLRRAACPFANLPTKRGGKFGQGVSAAEMRRCTWIEPRLVAQVRFTEWTSEGGLRHPVYLGLRNDKAPEEVSRETATA